MPFLIKQTAALLLLVASYTQPSAAPVPPGLPTMPEYTVIAAPETATPFRVKPGKPQIMPLEADGFRAVVTGGAGNLSAIMRDKRSVILFPRATPGAAHVTVFGANGRPVMARYVVISAPEEKYVRLRQAESAACGKDDACGRSTVYFCPNLCYQAALAAAP